MKRFFIVLLAVCMVPAYLFGATLSGVVTDSEGTPIENARVVLHGDSHHGGGGHGGGDHPEDLYNAWTDDTGAYSLEEVAAGTYICTAGAMGYQVQDVELTFADDSALTQDFLLVSGGHGGGGGGGHGGGMWNHPLELVELSGTTMIAAHNDHAVYLLDTDNDEAADYLLGFGPPNYVPESDISLPEAGDVIDITGGLMMHGDWANDHPMVMVFTLNGQPWFTPDTSGHHNGHGGWWHHEHGCEFTDPVLVDVEGYALVRTDMHDHERYALNVDDTELPEYRLDFGRDDYSPDNGAERPLDGDWVEITGGLIEGCPHLPTIIVYEINGIFWRAPGDTTGLGPQPTTAVGEEIIPQPSNHLLLDAYPNPFNPSTTVTLTLPMSQSVTVRLYDLTGRLVTELLNETLPAGERRLVLDGSSLASGVYFIEAKTATNSSTRRIQLVK